QIKVAEASAAAQAARLMMLNCPDEATSLIAQGEVPDIERKVAYRRDGAYSVGLCTKAVDLIAGISGAGGLYNRNPVQRAFRDVHAVNAHIAFNMDMAGTAYGRVAMGHSPDNPTL
ncbi:MAG: acyl-CoA dehydrogenase, partial [Pseudomonadota bacterium]